MLTSTYRKYWCSCNCICLSGGIIGSYGGSWSGIIRAGSKHWVFQEPHRSMHGQDTMHDWSWSAFLAKIGLGFSAARWKVLLWTTFNFPSTLRWLFPSSVFVFWLRMFFGPAGNTPAMVLFKTYKPKTNMVNKLESHLSSIIFLFSDVSNGTSFHPINNWKWLCINREDKHGRIILLVIAKYKPDRTQSLGSEGVGGQAVPKLGQSWLKPQLTAHNSIVFSNAHQYYAIIYHTVNRIEIYSQVTGIF